MFEEICLVCGKSLEDDAQAYCSEDCQNLDTSSPSISSASSAVSSPHLGYATGGEVPALVPSALGSALNKYRSRHHYSISSSSASSTSWSVVTDDEEDTYLGVSSYHSNPFHDSADSLYEGSSKSANFLDSMMKPSALSYARRPSGTNNRSTVPNPNPHRSTSSTHFHEVPRSAPLHSHLPADDDPAYSDVGFSSRDDYESDFPITKPNPSPKSRRNRASLPACFSLLMSSLADGKRVSPVSSSSGNTLPRPSPPTPKVTLSGLSHSSSTVASQHIHHTPRGRRRTQDGSRSSRRSGVSSSRSHSRSRARRVLPQFSPRPLRSRDLEEESASGLARGRPTVRRNSSPLPQMRLSSEALEVHNRVVGPSPVLRKSRGRATAEVDVDAPGLGHGRSGLLDRERGFTGCHRPTRVL